MYYIELEKMMFRKLRIEDNFFYIADYKKRTLKKLVKRLKRANIQKVICSNTILKEESVLNYLYANNINVYNGKILFKKIIGKVYEYLKNLGYKLERYNVSILVNENSSINTEVIYNSLKYFKSISIITNHINRFSLLEKRLEEEGIVINFSRNKKKSLKKANFILNIDFPNELINKFNINNDSLIINLEEDIIISKKSFKGININFYDLDCYEIEKENFNKNLIFEALNFEKKDNSMIKNVKVKKLIGNRGEIKKEEFINYMKKLS